MLPFEPDALVDDPAVRRELAAMWNDAPHDREVGAWLIRVTSPQPGWKLVKWARGKELEASTPSPAPQAAQAIVHTHPPFFTAKYPVEGPKPSHTGGNTGKGDWGAALQKRLPNYVLSATAIWRVLPDPRGFDPRQVAGVNWQQV
jgi:hypothetical protein